MAATFPGGVKVFTTKQAGDQIASAHINDLQDEVVAVETELRKTTGSVVSHGSLAGLSNNDHPQYKRVSEMAFVAMPGLSDDTATSFSPVNKQGFLLYRRLGAAMGAVISFDAVTGTAYCFMIAGHSSIETRTGVLSGTTGTDGKITFSAHTDGKIYIENRLGTTLYGGYITL